MKLFLTIKKEELGREREREREREIRGNSIFVVLMKIPLTLKTLSYFRCNIPYRIDP